MGYRSRLGRINKSEREKYRGKTSDQVYKMIDEDYSPYRLKEHEQLYEMGKDCDFKIKPDQFYDFDVYEEYESEFHILSKAGLRQIIDEYHEIILKSYKDDVECNDFGKIKINIKSKFDEWNKQFNLLPYYLDNEHTDGYITPSWMYEYAIFNLVYIYKSFDWENDYLIYSAW